MERERESEISCGRIQNEFQTTMKVLPSPEHCGKRRLFIVKSRNLKQARDIQKQIFLSFYKSTLIEIEIEIEIETETDIEIDREKDRERDKDIYR